MHSGRLKGSVKHFLFFAGSGTFLLLLAAFILFYYPGTSGATRVVEISSYGFSTATVKIQEGDTILFKNIGSTQRWVASDTHPTHSAYPGSDYRKCGTFEESLILDSCGPIDSGQTYAFNFQEAGEWDIHDHLFPKIGMTVTVESVQEHRIPSRYVILSLLSSVVHGMTELGDSALNFFAVTAARAKGGVPVDPLYGPFSGVDLVTLDNYETAPITRVIESDRETIRMISRVGLPETLRRVTEEPTFAYDSASCHTAMHVIGRMAFDLSGFQALTQCSTACFSGCYHGALERMATNEDPYARFAEAEVYCGNQSTVFEKDQCFHGIGHAFMIFSEYQLKDALNQCGTFGVGPEKSSCYSGVVMEYYIGDAAIVGAVNPTLPSVTNSDRHFPCSLLADDSIAQEWCYKAQPNHFLRLFGGDYQKAGAECMNAPEPMRGACFMRLGQLRSSDVPSPARAAEEYCAIVPREYFDECLIGGLRFVIVNPGVDPEGGPVLFCKELQSSVAKEICYTEYTGKLKDMFNDRERREFICGMFETPYDASCMSEQ